MIDWLNSLLRFKEYQILQVTPGTYTLKVEKPGFSVLLKSDITLAVNVPSTVDGVLEVGAVGSTVNVEADSAQINTVDGSVGNAFQEKQINELPLQTRNVVELLSIQPGVTQTGEVLGAVSDWMAEFRLRLRPAGRAAGLMVGTIGAGAGASGGD